MHIKVSVLKMFLAVVKAGNIQEAANAVGRSPSAVSTALKLLEENVGGGLFETDRKDHPTALGKYLFKVAQAQVEAYEKALYNVNAFARGELGKIQIAAVPSVAVYILPSIIKEFVGRWPNVEIELRDTDSLTIARWVEEGKVDFGIGGEPRNARVKFDLLFEDELVLVFPATSTLVHSKAAVNIEELNRFSFITNGIVANSIAPPLQAFHKKAQLNVHNTSSLLAFVRAGVGITILPKLTVPHKALGIRMRALGLEDSRRKIGVISNRVKSDLPAAKLMSEFLMKELGKIHLPNYEL